MSLVRRAMGGGSAFGGANNPLRMLGLASSLLTMGLSEDDIYEIAQIMAKRILGKIHEDKSGVDTQETRRVIEAMRALQERSTFDTALEELRRERSFISAEMAQVLEKVKAQERQLEERDERIAELTRTKPDEEQNAFLNAYLAVQHSYVREPALVADIHNCKGVLLAEMEVGNIHEPKQMSVDQIRKELRRLDEIPITKDGYQADHQEVINRAQELFAGSTLAMRGVRRIIADALRSKRPLPEVRWDSIEAAESVGLNSAGIADSVRRYAWRERVEPNTTYDKVYRKALENIAELSGLEPTDMLIVSAAKYTCSRPGVIDLYYGANKQRLAMLGCIDTKEVGPLFGSLKVKDHRLLADTKLLAKHLQPYLWNAGLLVCVVSEDFWPGDSVERQLSDYSRLVRQRDTEVILPGVIFGIF